MLKKHHQICKKPDLMCYIYKYANKNQELLHKHRLNERVIEEARWNIKRKLKTRFACIGTVQWLLKGNSYWWRLLYSSACWPHEGIANIETYRDRQGQTRKDRGRQRQAGTSRDRQGWTGSCRDKQGQKGIVPACPCFSLLFPAFSLLVPALSLVLTGIIGK